ncbi:extracellular matrix regulator RemB [Fusobacterium mortiferum]|uniref:DUF370 domain-containing protein n=2 Tax=Fusobacterium TaxID=848 RepID=A0ABS2G0S5_FUSMR|nr:extracellular matrix/biofilm biosynthesis regulator RemA family protein [Fusobacterium sp.]MBM6821332.1 DUF370 domain-containing protein [Fusobacterium mortiferum]MBM6874242.1 DUF370 domain-containing protein [Fusobacterium mortiferum]MBU3841977.1 DUF370 domain-containing protein [Candidatus Fusobacterium pullicola]MDO5788887.1 DUF370 domain-containing protein [Fusobacterium sp.]
MYVFLEEKILIPSKEILLIIDYIHITNEENRGFYREQLEKKEVIDLAGESKKTVVITDNKIYFSSYGTQTLMSRGNEYFNIIGGRK